VREDGIPVCVKEVGRPERAQLRSEARDDRQPIGQRRLPVFPERRQLLQERAERVLGVRVSDPPEAAGREAVVFLDAGQHAVVGEHVRLPTKLARERLRVAQEPGPLRRPADVRDHRRAADLLVPHERQEAAVARRLGLPEEKGVALLHERDPPAIPVRSALAAVAGELVEGQTDGRWQTRGQGKQLTHTRWSPALGEGFEQRRAG
jgi:hypothetical protein